MSDLPTSIQIHNAAGNGGLEEGNKRPVLLSLFDGTSSICKPFLNAGWTVHTLDILNTHHPTICTDILKWEYEKWSGHFPDVIFAGPECKNYSQARTNAKKPRNLHYADLLVTKLLDIIDYFHKKNPKLQYFVENPDSSLMWKRFISAPLYADKKKHFLSQLSKLKKARIAKSQRRTRDKKLARYSELGICTSSIKEGKNCKKNKALESLANKDSQKDGHVVLLDYCQYGTLYRKRTRIMTNNPFRGLRCDPATCKSMKNGRHLQTAQRGPGRSRDGKSMKNDSIPLDTLHAYPDSLVNAVFKHVTTSLAEPRERKGLRI